MIKLSLIYLLIINLIALVAFIPIFLGSFLIRKTIQILHVAYKGFIEWKIKEKTLYY